MIDQRSASNMTMTYFPASFALRLLFFVFLAWHDSLSSRFAVVAKDLNNCHSNNKVDRNCFVLIQIDHGVSVNQVKIYEYLFC